MKLQEQLKLDALDEASGAAVMQLLQLQTIVFLCISDVANFARKWLSVTASVKLCITVVKCGFSASALRRLSHSSQASAIVALSDCNLSDAFATGCSYLFIYLSILNLLMDI